MIFSLKESFHKNELRYCHISFERKDFYIDASLSEINYKIAGFRERKWEEHAGDESSAVCK